MNNEVTDVHVRRVSIVSRASTRDPLNPDEPRRALLFKAEAPLPERTDMLAELEKRRIGTAGATPAAARPRTEAQIQQKEAEFAPLLTQMHDDIQRMKSDGTPGPIRERHEKAYGELHWANIGLRDPERATQLEQSAAPTEVSTLEKSEAALRKADPSLSPLEACKQAMRLNVDDYFSQSGTARPAPATGHGLAKDEEGGDDDGAPVTRRAAPTTDGLTAATALAAQIQAREGVGAAEAMRRAMRDPTIAAQYAKERGGLAAAA